jgi:S-adenosylmethionine:tRNA ribosyltransferase-isomerase
MIKLENYDYCLPRELIANSPASPRDSARLFVYNTTTDEIAFDTFAHIDQYLPTPSLLIFNNTKVVPARLWLTKETGGKIEVLLMMNEYRHGDELIKGVVDRRILPEAILTFKSGATLTVVKQEEQFFFFKPSVAMSKIWELLNAEGVTPIPPYIKGAALSETALREKYQSILAKYPASIAAPTASLHFTNRLLSKLEQKGVKRTEVTLHVGAGTFAPIDETNFRTKKLFTEYIDITKTSADAINRAKTLGIPVIPVGTTAMRTIESAAQNQCQGLALTSWSGPTNIFIYPPYEFKVADGLITNFHVPKSSLLLLVDALLRHKKAKRGILDLYNIAIREKFRFYSFGDGMLIL